MIPFSIEEVLAREILDSRGNPTLEASVLLKGGTRGRAAVPSGASTGRHEAVELRDRDPARYGGKGVRRAIRNVADEIAPALHGRDASRQRDIDRCLCDLDGSADKSRLGANAILGVSMAVARAAAAAGSQPLYQHLGTRSATTLPMPFMNVINGGRHASNDLDFQEFMIVPIGASTFSEALRYSVETYHALGSLLQEQGLSVAVGDEGGFAPRLGSHEQALELLLQAIEHAGYHPGRDIGLALDVAASEFSVEAGRYRLARSGAAHVVDEASLIETYQRLIEKYPILSIEDGLGEADWGGWRLLTERLGSLVQLVADDIFVTNPTLIRKGIAEGIANSVLVKLNQIGTVSETIEAIEIARAAGYRLIASHRSGETEDTFLADFAVATRVGQIKTGAPCRSERTSKYNRLLEIERELGAAATLSSAAAAAPKAITTQ